MNKEVGTGNNYYEDISRTAAKKITNTSGVGKSNNYYEDIYNSIYLLTATPTTYTC